MCVWPGMPKFTKMISKIEVSDEVGFVDKHQSFLQGDH